MAIADRVEEIRVGLDQFNPPISHDAWHYPTSRQRQHERTKQEQ
jgi:hypothetical protein